MGRQAEHASRHRLRFRPHAGYIAANAIFASVFVAVILSAFHAPSPHGLPVGIVAPTAVTGQVEKALQHADPGGFSLRAYGSEAAARSAIAHNELDAAMIDSPGSARLLVARAAGTAPAQTLTAAFEALAARSGQSLAVTDVAPPLAGDSLALSPFFVVLAALIPSMAAGSASALVFRRARPAWAVGAPVVAAIACGAVTAGVADGIAGLGHYPAIAGIVALFALAVAAPTAALARIWPPLVALAVLVFIVFGIPVSAGPSGLAPFLPGFLRVLHPVLQLGDAASAVRGTVYFGGYGTAGPLWVLAGWAIAGMAALALVMVRQARRPGAALRAGAAPAAAPQAPAAAFPGAAGWPAGGTRDPLESGDVVAGFDNSGPARRALGEAARLAAARHGTLHVVYADHAIVDSDLSGFGHAEMEEARDQDAAAVAEAAARIAGKAGVKYAFEQRKDPPADTILSVAHAVAARSAGDPVIVVGRAGHAARHLLGSVPARLLHHSPYPVLTIP